MDSTRMPGSYLKLLYQALPAGFDPRVLLDYGKLEWWHNNQPLACAYALRKCDRINWHQYLAMYQDVAKSGIDPVLHFVRHGIYEGRKIFLNQSPKQFLADSRPNPKVSIIVPNYNNVLYIEKCIHSLISQDLEDIEILFIDDGSTDNSLEVIEYLSATDRRIEVISLKNNKSQHVVRKIGVECAHGEYIMFLDSDDAYVPNACRIAYESIKGKYDFVEFNMILLTPPHGDYGEDARLAQWINSGPRSAYTDHEIIWAMYRDHTLNDLVSNKIFEASLCKSAFAAMSDVYMLGAEDTFEALVLASRAKSAAKIVDELYLYRRGSGTTSGKKAPRGHELALLRLEAFQEIRDYIQTHQLDVPFAWIKPQFIKSAAASWLRGDYRSAGDAAIERMIKCFGILDIVISMYRTHSRAWADVARKFHALTLPVQRDAPISHIGIVLHNLKGGGSQNVALQEIQGLVEAGYTVTLFLSEFGEDDLHLPPNVRKVYCGSMQYESNAVIQRLRMLDRLVGAEKIDLIIYHCSWDKSLLWNLILFHMHKIPVVAYMHAAFYIELLNEDSDYVLQYQREVLKCCEGVLVLSRADELYYRIMGVNAHCITNPITAEKISAHGAVASQLRNKRLVVFGRLGDPTKNVKDCLRVLAELAKSEDDIHLVLIGSFANGENNEKEFWRLANELGVRQRIDAVGWQADPTPYLDSCAMMISTAWHESFCLAAVEAQQRGLPVVMYDMPIAPAEDNPSIIKTPMGDWRCLAKEVAALLNDEALLQHLSHIAITQGRKYSANRHIRELLHYLDIFSSQCEITWYHSQDYDQVLASLAFYGAHKAPWFQR